MGRNFIELFVLLLTILGAFFSLKVGIFTFWSQQQTLGFVYLLNILLFYINAW
jgi:uncharacterized membrane protein YuzA (DUF378 family)